MAHGRHASIGDADVAAPEMRERLTEGALDRRTLAHIDLDCDGAFADLLRRSLGRPPIDIGDRDFNAASRQRVRNGAADALRAAGYERALAVELRVRRTVRRHCLSHTCEAAAISTKSKAAKALFD